MSKTTIALESLVATVIANRPAESQRPTARQRAETDKAFAAILKLIAPRIRHFIRQYGLAAHWDDAEQAAAIGVHRAIEAYEPEKAQFTTFVNWQIRGELQSLRFRLMTDQRSSAKKVEATTVSIHGLTQNAEGEENSIEAIIEDEDALDRVESGASDYLAEAATADLIDAYIDHLRKLGTEQLKKRARPPVRTVEPRDMIPDRPRPRFRTIDPVELEKLEQKLQRNRTIVARRVFDNATIDELSADTGLTKERVRQITKRAARTIAELAGGEPKFQVMAEYRRAAAAASKAAKEAAAPAPAAPPRPAAPLLPPMGQPHNRLSSVTAIDPAKALPARSREPLAAVTPAAQPAVEKPLYH